MINISTGRLGSELANFLAARGHTARLLLGQHATYHGTDPAGPVEVFSTTADLRDRLAALANEPIGAVFHAAAVSDFGFGKVYTRSKSGELTQIKSKKIPTGQGPLLAELVPTPKVLAELRQWFPKACIIGWKYELEGKRPGVIRLAEKQIAECLTDACVANGAAYGEGFGLVRAGGEYTHLEDHNALFTALEAMIGQ